ncbi:arylsulfatase [Xylariomycetidae sp. FL0641]|nr:arylsulfatase [Xylariomycetidae sp. FL0641]
MFLHKVLVSALALATAAEAAKKPNIVVFLTDDQDYRLGSLDYMKVVQREIIEKGVNFVNHHVTTAVCCPSRATMLKGQMAHNTNITHVRSPGGDYEKWVLAGNDKEYMPHYMKAAGYRTEYIGKLLNGYSLFNYDIRPKGWDWIDGLMDPYNAAFNTVVMSQNGETPMHYPGYHQSDVIRAKTMDRLEHLTTQDDPWMLFLAPTNPHVDNTKKYTEPLARHWNDFANVTAPRLANWNPEQKFQDQKSYWIKDLELMNQTQIDWADMSYRRRIQSLQGIDEIIDDTIKYLEAKGEMENTYFIFTSDNGYHIGQFRQGSGKSTPYAEDSNVPLVVRGPGIPKGVQSTLPSTHNDMVPTLLQIAGVDEADFPKLLDGRGLLPQWQDPTKKDKDSGLGINKEVINIEHWGFGTIEAPAVETFFPTTTYKTIRLVGDQLGYLYIIWCTGETELYNIMEDKYELTNLARSTDPKYAKIIDRMNALLLYMKSCGEESCRSPWAALQPPNATAEITSFAQAMDSTHDAFFAGFPKFAFGSCMDYQYAPNETPFYPPESESLGGAYRGPTDNYVLTLPEVWIAANPEPAGSWAQRNVMLPEIMKTARQVTPEEIFGPNKTTRAVAVEMKLVGDANGS